jgi:hypothetical protein
MKKWISFILIVFISVNSFSQVRFQKTYKVRGDCSSTITPTSDNTGYFLTVSTADPTISYKDVFLAKLDLNGDTLWTKYYGGGGSKGLGGFYEDSSGNILILGATYGFGMGNEDIYLIKTNDIGDTIWTKTIGNSFRNIITNSIKLVNESTLLLGLTDSIPGLDRNDYVLIKIDSLGNIVWNKCYEGGFYPGSLGGFIQLNDGSLIMSGSTQSYGAGDYDALIIKTDSLGNLIWTKTVGGSLGESLQRSVLLNNGIVLSGVTKSFGAGGYDLLVTKMDYNGNVIWAKSYGTSTDEYGGHISSTNDGGFIISGVQGLLTGSSQDILLTKIDSLGNIQWAKKYGGTDVDLGGGGFQTSDGGFFLFGTRFSASVGSYIGYIIKTDANGISGCNEQNISLITQDITSLLVVGNHTPNVYTDSTLVVKPTQTIVRNDGDNLISNTLCYSVVGVEENEANNKIDIYPNPSTNEITLAFEQTYSENTKITIQNVLGQTVYSESFKSNTGNQLKTLDISNLQNGVYFIQLKNQNKIYSTKFIKQ